MCVRRSGSCTEPRYKAVQTEEDRKKNFNEEKRLDEVQVRADVFTDRPAEHSQVLQASQTLVLC